MRILGVDTATSIASVALTENSRLLAEKTAPRVPCATRSGGALLNGNHAEVVLPLVASLLQTAQVSFADLSGLAVSIGPGSFTGLRIGLSTVKGLAYGSGIPVAGISTLLANAARVIGFSGIICSLLDARKNQVYAALFRRDGDDLIRLTEDSVQSPGETIACIRDLSEGTPCLFIGEGTIAYEKLLLDSFGDRVILHRGDCPSIASAVARLGEKECCSANSNLIASLTPVYLRPSEAQVKRKNFS